MLQLLSHKMKCDIRGLKLHYLLCNRLAYTIADFFFVCYSDMSSAWFRKKLCSHAHICYLPCTLTCYDERIFKYAVWVFLFGFDSFFFKVINAEFS